jgi:hypothetical protein
MTRFSTICALSSTMAALSLSANGVCAATVTVHTAVPAFHIHPPAPKGPKIGDPTIKTPMAQGAVGAKGNTGKHGGGISRYDVDYQHMVLPWAGKGGASASSNDWGATH